MRRVIVIAVFAVLLVAAMRSVALACPTCGEALGQQDAAGGGVAKGFFWSILFMMSVPYLLLTTFGGCMYWKVRRARMPRPRKPLRRQRSPLLSPIPRRQFLRPNCANRSKCSRGSHGRLIATIAQLARSRPGRSALRGPLETARSHGGDPCPPISRFAVSGPILYIRSTCLRRFVRGSPTAEQGGNTYGRIISWQPEEAAFETA